MTTEVYEVALRFHPTQPFVHWRTFNTVEAAVAAADAEVERTLSVPSRQPGWVCEYRVRHRTITRTEWQEVAR